MQGHPPHGLLVSRAFTVVVPAALSTSRQWHTLSSPHDRSGPSVHPSTRLLPLTDMQGYPSRSESPEAIKATRPHSGYPSRTYRATRPRGDYPSRSFRATRPMSHFSPRPFLPGKACVTKKRTAMTVAGPRTTESGIVAHRGLPKLPSSNDQIHAARSISA